MVEINSSYCHENWICIYGDRDKIRDKYDVVRGQM